MAQRFLLFCSLSDRLSLLLVMLKSLELDRALLVENDAQILDIEAQISELQAQISALEAAISTLHAEKHSAQQNLDSYKYPVLTLPNEIVGEIFQDFLPPYPEPSPLLGKDSPTILIHICHQWREIALTTPALWRSIDLRDVSVEAATSLACSWLERSGCLPLSLHATDRQDVFSVFPVFIPHRARWEHLDLRFRDPQHLQVLDGPSPLLRTLRILLLLDKGVSNPFILHDFPLLHTVSLDDYGTPSLALPWSQLTCLSLRSIYLEECISVLRQTQTLVTCKLKIWFKPFPAYQHVDVALLRLENLVLERCSYKCAEFVRLLVTPSLRRLELYEGYLHWADHHSDPIVALKSFVSKSGCMLNDLRITKASITQDVYRTAFPSIPSIQLLHQHSRVPM
ncbi:F-box domain-containing protein [Favolaschia claudopus]|uniref:F-box domain-containing protein n=1 Tax=Favolaschia claudopus TaxID=2862362 RepID=A0AAV9ZDJ2_9AGAR